jgi:hypothetical protein
LYNPERYAIADIRQPHARSRKRLPRRGATVSRRPAQPVTLVNARDAMRILLSHYPRPERLL